VRRAPGWRGWTCAAAGSTRRRGAGCSPSCPRAWRLCSATSNRKVAANLWPRHLNLVLARLCCRRHEYIRIGEAGACNINVAPSIAASVEHARLTERPAATAPGPWPPPWPPLPARPCASSGRRRCACARARPRSRPSRGSSPPPATAGSRCSATAPACSPCLARGDTVMTHNHR
jgi:hypothetical protein